MNKKGIAALGIVAIVGGVIILGAIGFFGLAINGIRQLSGG